MTLKSILKTTALVAIASTIVGTAFAASGPSPFATNASVEIVGLITVNEDANLNFGKIAPPASSFSDVTLAFDTGNISRTGTAVLLGGHSRGQYDFSGNTGSGFTITLTPGSCTGTGLSLQSLANTPATTLPQVDVQVGGVLRVESTATADPGPKTCGYTVAANY